MEEEEKQHGQADFGTKILDWVQRDMVYIVLMILVLGACAYTLVHTDSINDACNNHWIQQWEQSTCRITPYYNFTELDTNIIKQYYEAHNGKTNTNQNP